MKKSRVILYIIIVAGAFLYNFYYRPIPGNELITEEFKQTSAYINNIYKSDEYFKNTVLSETDKELYEKMISMSLNDEEDTIIECEGKCDYKYGDIYSAIYLDHPELISYQGLSVKTHDDYIEIINNFNLGKLQTYFGTRRIEREMDIIKRETQGMTDKEKIIYVYDYVASHNYDQIFMYSSSNQSAYSFFTKGTSVCAGFAKSSQMIFQNIGIESLPAVDNDHMWNYVKYEGKWYIFDATVGASYTDKTSKGYYNGLGETTTDAVYGHFKKYYPVIESEKLRDIFKL